MDSIMALFGAPLALEDHALRACYAALAIQNSMRAYGEEAVFSKNLSEFQILRIYLEGKFAEI